MICPIWKTPAQSLEKAGDFEVVDSPRAGGKYWISGTAVGEVNSFADNAKLLLTTWLCEQRRAGVDVPQIHSNVLDLVKTRKRLLVTQRLAAALVFLGGRVADLTSNIGMGDPGDQDTLHCAAETETKNIRELTSLFKMLEDTGHVTGQFFMDGSFRVHPTAAGWSEIERLSRPQSDSSQVFVAMWFNDAMNDAYSKGIAPALVASGYKPVRIDKKDHNNKIDDEIIAEIRRSRFVVADFTCEPKQVRGGVYYEAGFAQGLGLPVIWTCKRSSFDDVHFDTRQYAHLIWDTPADLLEQLKNRIGATVGDGPLVKAN